ncbi:excalibur calcium-binding domain-containing protein [Candidatus Peregrinibacteria bacterium]|nr:excalibur calcium-binding domain-containing protein [Candidatus Peregrinibacteria bacterium]
MKEAKTEAKTTAKTQAKTSADTIICTADVYNCSDFSSHGEAQSVMDYCLEMTGSDVHGLDGDNDGEGCESL